MLTFLYQYVRKNTNVVSIVVLAILFSSCLVGFHFRTKRLGPPLDLNISFDARDVKEFLCQCDGPNRRYIYATTQATLDVVFPFTYCSLFGILIASLFRKETATRLLVLPLLAFIADLSENAVTIYLALTFDCLLEPPTIPWLAIVLTPTKWFFIGASVLAIVVGLVGMFGTRQGKT